MLLLLGLAAPISYRPGLRGIYNRISLIFEDVNKNHSENPKKIGMLLGTFSLMSRG